MSAIASLINPLSDTGNPVILQFSTDQSNSLVYQDVALTPTPEVPVGPTSSIASGPQLAANSNIAAVQFQNMICVYGIVTTMVKSVDTNYLSLISPVVSPMAEIVTASGALASATGVNGTYLYFLAPQSLGSGVQLVELQLSNEGAQNLIPAPFPDAGSKLAAFYNPVTSKRWALFQDSSANIWFSIIDDVTPIQTPSSLISGARQGTAMAACYNAATNQFYVYFQDNSLELRRGSGSPNSFDVSTVTPLGIKLDSQTTISVTPDPTQKQNHVFFVLDSPDGRVIHHMIDSLS